MEDFVADIRLFIKTSSQSDDPELSENGQKLENVFEEVYSSVNVEKKKKIPNGEISVQREVAKPVVSRFAGCQFKYQFTVNSKIIAMFLLLQKM